jgi:LmbE family N-acetylglucosaminyl deacetylase
MTNPAIFFIPHQDDELLSMGAYILQHLDAGRDVHVVLMTDGQASGVRNVLASQGYPLSYAAFSKARDREFVSAMFALGLNEDHIHFENLEDGNLSRTKVKSVMMDYISAYGPGSYKTMSWMDEHKDHYILGRALDEITRAGEVPNNDSRFCRSLSYQDAPTPGGSWQRAKDNTRLFIAAWEYNVWNMNHGADAYDASRGPRYQIGFTSVKPEFDAMVADPKSWVHGPSTGYTAADRAAANSWLSARGLTPFL